MNRPGQPQQRPPNLTQNPALASQYRPPYPSYGIAPRNVNALPGNGFVTGLTPNAHRAPGQQSAVQSMVSQPTPGFLQRGQSYGFGAALGQHQPNTTLQQQSSSHQQQQTNGTSSSLPPHLQTPNLGNVPSASNASDVGLDPNDFPALGSTPSNSAPTGTNGTANGNSTSYASQAGTGVQLGAGNGTSAAQPRDFTPDDFPALGTPGQNAQNQSSSQENQSHPPGLNGFQHSDHRQNLLGALGGTIQPGTPGMLGLGQTRHVHPGFQQGQTETEKQRQAAFNLKLNQASQAWSSPNANPGSQSQTHSNQSPFSNASQPSTQPQQNGSHNSSASSTQPSAPPGVQPPFSQQTSGTNANSASQASFASNGAPGDSNSNPQSANPLNPNPGNISLQHPQTPAQQILVSAADRWGLLGLLAMLKNVGTELDQGMAGIGTDLGTMGLDLSYSGNLYSTFVTPWSDQAGARSIEPEFHLPSCYANVHAPPPGPTKAAAFNDETLFFMFYSSPRDALQEIAAQELWNRNWRYHKDLRLWITKESGTAPSQKVHGGEQGQYTFWDPENWTKERKDMTVLYADLEEKNTPAYLNGPGLILAQGQGQGQGQTQPVGLQHQAPGPMPVQRGSLQMGMAGL